MNFTLTYNIRIPTSGFPKRILYGNLTSGKQNQGGQRKRFKDSLKHCTRGNVVLKLTENMEQQASNKLAWGLIIHIGAALSEQQGKERLRSARKERQHATSTLISYLFRVQMHRLSANLPFHNRSPPSQTNS